MNVLLVLAHPGFPGQIPQSRKTVVLCVCVLFHIISASLSISIANVRSILTDHLPRPSVSLLVYLSVSPVVCVCDYMK